MAMAWRFPAATSARDGMVRRSGSAMRTGQQPSARSWARVTASGASTLVATAAAMPVALRTRNPRRVGEVDAEGRREGRGGTVLLLSGHGAGRLAAVERLRATEAAHP